MSSTTAPNAVRVRVQRFGTFLSGMVMPNIPAFIAWGFITALFISDSIFLPNGILGGFGAETAQSWQGAMTALTEAEDGTTFMQYVGLVGPMITYLLPLLIANTGGRMIYGERGGVVASIATMGVIIGSTIPMFIGAMIIGPLAAWVMKKIDQIWEGRIRGGFEMLVNNFSAGIVGMLLAIIAFFGVAPIVRTLTDVLGTAVDWLIATGLLPIASILIEPAKVFFLNNAINHGVLTPLGLQQVQESGQSILFLLEANPGPGLGLLLAFSIFGVGMAKGSAPGAAVIHFFGGIHEIYFPYVLAKPLTLIALIAGGAAGITANLIFGSGLRAPAAPGSIIAVYANTPVSSLLGVTLSVLSAAVVTFLVAAVILRAGRRRDLEAGEDGLAAAVAQTEANKGKKSAVLSGLGGAEQGKQTEGSEAAPAAISGSTKISTVVFACDAGMGSSAMGATVLRNKVKKAGIEGVSVTNAAIANLTGDEDLIITQSTLTDRAKGQSPDAVHVSVGNFMNAPEYDEIVERLRTQGEG